MGYIYNVSSPIEWLDDTQLWQCLLINCVLSHKESKTHFIQGILLTYHSFLSSEMFDVIWRHSDHNSPKMDFYLVEIKDFFFVLLRLFLKGKMKCSLKWKSYFYVKNSHIKQEYKLLVVIWQNSFIFAPFWKLQKNCHALFHDLKWPPIHNQGALGLITWSHVKPPKVLTINSLYNFDVF